MSNRIEIAGWRKDKSIAAIVAATFPDYRRTKVVVEAREKVTLYGLNWEGGSRSEYRSCTLNGEALGSAARANATAPWVNAAEGSEMPIPAGAALVKGGHFCGKVATLYIYMNPADMPRMLPAPAEAA